MFTKIKMAVLIGLLVGASTAAPTLARPLHHRHAAGAPMARAPAVDGANGPAQMIEIRPGTFVGSYQCTSGGRACSDGP